MAKPRVVGARCFGPLGGRELLERPLEGLVGLGSEHDQAAVEQEGRDRVDADGVGLAGRARNDVSVQVAADRGFGVFELELGRERAEGPLGRRCSAPPPSTPA